MAEREILFTGVGGQGVQLAAQVLARAATLEGRQVMLLGTYGGTMRGGNTDCALVIADGPISAPPILARTGSAVVLHHEFFEPLRPKLRPGALVVLNTSLFRAELDREAYQVVEIDATRIATALGSELAGSMVMAGGYARATGIVTLDSLQAGMRESVPSYRTQHIERNDHALAAGYDAVPETVARAFPSDEAA